MTGESQWPEWWQWELEFTPHVYKRMLDRCFNEVDIRIMLENASGYRKSLCEGRFVIITRWENRSWEVVVEPDELTQQLLVITAYAKEKL